MVVPTTGGQLNPLVMLAAELAGVARVFRIGGAQAVAALAYGVDPLPRCDIIVGPGNAYVAEAKRQLYGVVGIDMVAGPSEILVIADASVDLPSPRFDGDHQAHSGRHFFDQAHIPGSRFAGPGASPAGLEALRKAVAAVPKTKTVVLYCGCCPWERCPNMEQPWRLLVAAGFTDVRVLYIPTNFGRDWVGKGHPSASGSGDRG